MATIARGKFLERTATTILTPLVGRMSNRRWTANVAIGASNLAGRLAHVLHFNAWEKGSALQRAATLAGVKDYKALVEHSLPYQELKYLNRSEEQSSLKPDLPAHYLTAWYFAIPFHLAFALGALSPSFVNFIQSHGRLAAYGIEMGSSVTIAAVIAAGLTAGQQLSTLMEADRRNNIRPAIKEKVHSLLEQGRNKAGLSKLFWYFSTSAKLLAGKLPGAKRNGLNFFTDGSLSLPAKAAGPGFARKVARISLPIGIAALVGAQAVEAVEYLGDYLGFLLPALEWGSRIFFSAGVAGLIGQYTSADGAYRENLLREAIERARGSGERIETTERAKGYDETGLAKAEIRKGLMGVVAQNYQGRREELVRPIGVNNTLQGGEHGVIKLTVEGQKRKIYLSALGIQERLAIFTGANMSMAEVQERQLAVQTNLGLVLQDDPQAEIPGICSEGGWGAKIYTGERGAYELFEKAVIQANIPGLVLGQNFFFGVDGALDHLYRSSGTYELDGKPHTSEEVLDFWRSMIARFPFLYMEDIAASREEEYDTWAKATEEFGSKVWVVGDDIACTRARFALDHIGKRKLYNMLLLKLDQAGSLLELLRAADAAHRLGADTISSHRSQSGLEQPFAYEVEIAMALSEIREGRGRCVAVKFGGASLIERPGRRQQVDDAMADWASPYGTREPLPLNRRIVALRGQPDVLNTGLPTLQAKLMLDQAGLDFRAVIAAGASKGPEEVYRLPRLEDSIKRVAWIVDQLGLIGEAVGDLPQSYVDFERSLFGLELRLAKDKGQLSASSSWEEIRKAAERKENLGGDAFLGVGLTVMRLMAAAQGIPSWLMVRRSLYEVMERYPEERDFYESMREFIL